MDEKLAALFANTKARPQGFAIPGKVRIDRHSKIEKVKQRERAGAARGSDPLLSNEVIVLSAHLDHLGIVPGKNGDTIANGAMDNAVGVATMMEVARAFVDSGAKPEALDAVRRPDRRGKGLLGSEYLAKYPTLKGKKVVGNVNLDMPMLTHDFTDVVAFGAEHSTVGQAVARAAKAVGVALISRPGPGAAILCQVRSLQLRPGRHSRRFARSRPGQWRESRRRGIRKDALPRRQR